MFVPARTKNDEAPPLNSAGSREAGNDRRDGIGTVVSFSKGHDEDNPGTLDPEMREFALGIYRLDDRPIVVTDVDRVLDITVQ